MRPIDADKVKAESREHCKTCTLNGTKHCKTCVVNLICDRLDLQPTVEPEKVSVANVIFDKDQLEQIVRDKVIEPIKNGELVIKEERPQDKWGKWVITEIRCPICLEYFQTDCYSTEELNECPSCGAEMRKGNET